MSFLKIYLFETQSYRERERERERERDMRQRETFLALVHSTNPCKIQDWAKLKPEQGASSRSPTRHTSMELNQNGASKTQIGTHMGMLASQEVA